MGADKTAVATHAHVPAAGGARRPAGGQEAASAAQTRLVSSLAANLEALRDDGRDARIFEFLATRDPRIVAALRRAIAWVARHDGGVGTVDVDAIEGRDPKALASLARLAIAAALGRLAKEGSLGMPTFEHAGNSGLLDDLRGALATRIDGRIAVDDLQEAVMRAVAGEPPTTAPKVAPLARLVEELAARPAYNEADIVAMAVELALERP